MNLEHEVNAFNLLWTFYNITTPKGDLSIRWLGLTHGDYSVEVSCYFVNKEVDNAN